MRRKVVWHTHVLVGRVVVVRTGKNQLAACEPPANFPRRGAYAGRSMNASEMLHRVTCNSNANTCTSGFQYNHSVFHFQLPFSPECLIHILCLCAGWILYWWRPYYNLFSDGRSGSSDSYSIPSLFSGAILWDLEQRLYVVVDTRYFSVLIDVID